jgi:hypothetical protein
MSDATMSPHRPARRERLRLGVGPNLVALGRGLAFFGLMLAGLALLLVLLAPVWVIAFAIHLFVWNGRTYASSAVLAGSAGTMSASPSPSPPGAGGTLSAPTGTPLHQSPVMVMGQQWPRDFIPLALIVAVLIIGWFLLPRLLLALRSLLKGTRRLSSEWCGVLIASPYRRPGPATSLTGTRRRIGWLLADPATWRDLLWVVVSAAVCFIAAVLPIVLAVTVGNEFLRSLLGLPTPQPAFPGNVAAALVVTGAAMIAAGVLAGPWLLRGYGWLADALLAPTGQAGLAARVEHLAQTRYETLDTGAAEIRRIERDLHDGAQARLVAMGMTLNAAE